MTNKIIVARYNYGETPYLHFLYGNQLRLQKPSIFIIIVLWYILHSTRIRKTDSHVSLYFM